MPEISMKNMLEAGVHFGHQTHRWNPKMKPFIFAPRNGIYIIDLEKTVKHAREACTYVKNVVAEGGKVLFVATKKQGKQIVRDAADRAGMPCVTERWLGGTLTNFTTIRQGVERLEQLETWKTDGTYEALPKKEVVVLERKRKKLELSLGGVRNMRALPAALFVIDPEMEHIAVREANRLGIPVVAVVDTNCDPDRVDFVIPGNDDAIKSVTLFANLIADSCLEGAAVYEQRVRTMTPATPAAPEAVVAASAQPTPEVAAKAPTGPVVERVKRPSIKNIPTEIDYRDEALLADDETEETPEEASSEEGKE
ncbi:MAG: 30S ribosomal protein S2 [Deltaproteobacteria bacterium]